MSFRYYVKDWKGRQKAFYVDDITTIPRFFSLSNEDCPNISYKLEDVNIEVDYTYIVLMPGLALLLTAIFFPDSSFIVYTAVMFIGFLIAFTDVVTSRSRLKIARQKLDDYKESQRN